MPSLDGRPPVTSADRSGAGSAQQRDREYDDDRDIPLGLAAATDVEWFAMGDEALLTRTHDFAGEATTRFWVTTEASATRAVVRALRKDHGVGKERIHAQAYWSAAG